MNLCPLCHQPYPNHLPTCAMTALPNTAEPIGGKMQAPEHRVSYIKMQAADDALVYVCVHDVRQWIVCSPKTWSISLSGETISLRDEEAFNDVCRKIESVYTII